MSSHFLTNHNYSVQSKSSSSPSKIINTIKSTTTPTTNKRKHSYYYPTTTTMASAKIGPTQSPLLANQPKDTINLAVGHPMHSELPNKIISDALKRCGSKLRVTGYQAKTEQNENDVMKMQSKKMTTTTTTATTTTKNVFGRLVLTTHRTASNGDTPILAKPNDIVV